MLFIFSILKTSKMKKKVKTIIHRAINKEKAQSNLIKGVHKKIAKLIPMKSESSNWYFNIG